MIQSHRRNWVLVLRGYLLHVSQELRVQAFLNERWEILFGLDVMTKDQYERPNGVFPMRVFLHV